MLTKTIPSYLFVEYNDDDDLQAFVDSYNAMTQQYVDWFNKISLPNYTGPLIVGQLLDWVAQGLYGMMRPTLTSGSLRSIGLLNTYMFDTLQFNASATTGKTTFTSINDDMFKRMITWNFYKGDGKNFTMKWLKRRIVRFLVGVNGTAPNIDNTGQVTASIITLGIVTVHINPGALDISAAAILIQAINAGVCQLPFQLTFNVTSG